MNKLIKNVSVMLAVITLTCSGPVAYAGCDTCGTKTQSTAPTGAPTSCSSWTFPNCNGTTSKVTCTYSGTQTCECTDQSGATKTWSCWKCSDTTVTTCPT